MMDKHKEHSRVLKDYLMENLTGNNHRKCGLCEKEVESWHQLDGDINDWVDSLEPTLVSEMMAAKLKRGAKKVRQDRGVRYGFRTTLIVTMTAAIVLIGLFVVLSPSDHVNQSTAPQVLGPLNLKVLASQSALVSRSDDTPYAELAVPEQGQLVVKWNRDRIALRNQSKVRLSKKVQGALRIELLGGTVVISAGKRKREEQLTVEAMGHLVKVVGTQFQVSLLASGSVEVAVSEGQVEVESLGSTKKNVDQGEVLQIGSDNQTTSSDLAIDVAREMDRLLDVSLQEPDVELDVEESENESENEEIPVIPKANRLTEPSISEIRKLVLDGKYSRAQTALVARLKQKPSDMQALELLANCRRKLGDWSEAIKSFNRLIHLGNSSQSNRARFLVATLMQDKLKEYQGALALLEDYLENKPRPLEAEAMFRLARIQFHLGENASAQVTVAKIVKKYHGSPISLQAQKLASDNDKKRVE